ncbi:MAG: hypothetical protein E6H86_11535 [Chloroflexi bacterium]|nr:MAG: hypothetical protein E6H86_11535 [Chloroflexota bacterium]
MKLHRAISLMVMMLMAVVLVVFLTAVGIANFDTHSLIALGVVVAAAAISGVAFSWNRYFKRP